MHLARDVGRVQTTAGTKAALDGLKIAGSPRQMARVAKLAEKEGSRTRAILKLVGGGALALTLFTFNTSLWLLGALFTLVGLVASLKSATERGTQRFINYPQAAPAAALCGADGAGLGHRPASLRPAPGRL